ncbi:MAG: hypothetical protein KC486_09265 [Myxococcales bacterium]|nr:hypothetical protein [Myxococcales bacterium]
MRLLTISAALAFALVIGARTGHGQPAEAGDAAADAGKAASGETEAKRPPPPPPAAKKRDAASTGKGPAKTRVGELRRNMEQDLAEIGKIAQKAQRDADMVKIACVTDKQDRAEGVMDVATPEIALLQGGKVDPTSASFANAKVEEAALRLGKLLDEARACTGSPAADGNSVSDNLVDEGRGFPAVDPTASPGYGPGTVPPVDPGRRAVSSPVQ